uniref:Uncharacterized protein n=2 Tax=Acrobeloides nanus TaxID=290746 RepID=A0A914E115_9BILA
MQLQTTTQKFYTKIYQQNFSPDEKYLIASDAFNRLILFPLTSPQKSNKSRRIWRVKQPIYSMCTFSGSNILLCGDTTGKISGYSWNNIVGNQNGELKSNFVYSHKEREINNIASLDEGRKFLLGYGDGSVGFGDLEMPGKLISSFESHSDQVNEIATRSDAEFLSCYNDGTVSMWDIRTGKKPVKVFNIHEEKRVLRQGFSKGIFTLAVDNEFMVCGGDVELGLWHIGSGTLATTFNKATSFTDQTVYYATEMSNGSITAAGTQSRIQYFDYSGNLLSTIPLKIPTVYSACSTKLDKPRVVTAVAGKSSNIEVILNHGYVSATFDTIEEEKSDLD